MRSLILASGLIFLSSTLFAARPRPVFSPEEMEAAQRSPEAFQIDPRQVRLRHIGSMRLEKPFCRPSENPAIPNIGIIINIGKEVWKIIEANKPVVDIRQSYATALPGGTTDWNSLGGWSQPQGDIYELEAKNLYGWIVVKARFNVLRTWGGSLNGVGRYLTAVTTEPLLVDVFWGYRFSMDAQVPRESLINVGTAQAPLAGLTHTLKWKMSTALKEIRGTHVFYMQGDGLFRQIGSPLPDSLEDGFQRAERVLSSPVVWD